MRIWLLGLTDFGDAAVLIPLTAAIMLWLLLFKSVHSAAWWTISVGFCVGLTALLKIFFYGCPPASDMRSPSGHAAFSVLVYGAIALVTAVQTRGLHRAVAICVGGGMILTIAVSRLLLEIHSLPEVSLGFVIGTASLILFGRIYLQSPRAKVWPLLVTSGVLIALLHGQELYAEEFLHRVTGYLGVHCR